MTLPPVLAPGVIPPPLREARARINRKTSSANTNKYRHMRPNIDTSKRGMCTARIARSKSGNGVLDARTIAACMDIHDLRAMLMKRSIPVCERVSVHGPISTIATGDPGTVKINGNAAIAKGKASADRLSTYPIPKSDSISIDKIIASRNM
jgi:hypothetical protein